MNYLIFKIESKFRKLVRNLAIKLKIQIIFIYNLTKKN